MTVWMTAGHLERRYLWSAKRRWANCGGKYSGQQSHVQKWGLWEDKEKTMKYEYKTVEKKTAFLVEEKKACSREITKSG